MSPTGKGETAVPTAASFRAVRRIFPSVSVVDEFRTSKMSWTTGEPLLPVCLQPRAQPNGKLKLKLQSYTGKYPPTVAPGSKEARLVIEHLELLSRKRKRRFSVNISPPEDLEADEEAGSPLPKKILRCPEVRGLRFCPRNQRFSDRDINAALAIARLRVMELDGSGRPAAFSRIDRREASGAASRVDDPKGRTPEGPPSGGGPVS
jgi:hypothetical protein